MRCLIIRAGALGDTVLTLPAIRALRRHYPDMHLTVAGYPELWSVAGTLVDAVEPIDSARFSSLFAERPSPALLAWLAPFDLAVAWTARDGSGAMRAAGIPRIIHASPYPPPGVHATEWLLETLALPHPPPDADLLSQRRPGDGVVYLHPGAGARWKRWPAERFATLADWLMERNYPAVLVQGPADEQAIHETQAAASHPLPILREVALPALADRLSRARLFVGNDSGVTHLAASAGVPTLALFGPTDPASWAPRGDVTVLRQCDARATGQGEIRVCDNPDCLAALPIPSVIERVEGLLRANVDNPVDNSPLTVEKEPDAT